ncbi:MAG: TonB-dependent receptor plug domain-containing protein [Bacteroidales bacterium]|nr:TonB-dependent receptor plug domain-containing protein [Bacteroidales bacterium]
MISSRGKDFMTHQLSTIIGFFCGGVMMVFSLTTHAQQHDTIQKQLLQEIRVFDEAPAITRIEMPTQVSSREQMERQQARQLSDVVRQMAGITLKDYGGVGGIKTVSARGLGSQFTALTIDGVGVTECQNGQIDIGRYLVGNSAFVSFANGQHNQLLQSARGYAAGNVLNMETLQPRFTPDENTQMKITIEGGSFGMLSPSFSLGQKITDKLTLSLWGNYLRSDGDYPFTLYYGRREVDSSAVLRRKNSQVWMSTYDANLFYTPARNQQLMVKTHYSQSHHHLPGAVILYNTVNASEQTRNQTFFIQSRYRLHFWDTDTGSHRMRLQVLAKYQLGDEAYDDTSKHVVSGTLHNDYAQREGYVSATLLYQTLRGLRLSVAEDGSLNTLHSNLPTNDNVCRWTSLTVLAVNFDRPRLTLSANLLGTLTNEEAETSTTKIQHNNGYQRMSPYAGIIIKPFSSIGLRLRYYIKENYRIPSFNELYYLSTTRSLNPEKALQQNIGLTYIYGTESQWLHIATLTVDAYHNQVTDKIVAIPRQNMFVWSMINMGEVDIHGIDIKSEATMTLQNIDLTLSGSYSYQKAVDHTNPKSKTYGHQIPYTPQHSGHIALYIESPWINIGYDITLVGDRYCLQQNTEENLVTGYIDQGITVSRKWKIRHGELQVQAHVLNLFDVQYEVVRSYPMMGRNFRMAVSYDF